MFTCIHHPHRKLWWYFSFVCVCVCVLSVQHITYVRVSGDDLTYHVKEISPPYLYKFCTHYSGEWVQGKSPLSQTLILKLPRTNKKKGGKVDKVFFCFFFSTGNITWCASTKTDWSCLLCDTTCAWLQLTISGHCIQWLFRAKFQHSYNFHSFRYITCHALWWSWHFLHEPSF